MSAKKGNNSGGFKGLIATGITLILMASGLIGIAKVNDINSPSDLFAYFKSYSDKIWECSDGSIKWECANPFGGGSNGGSSSGGSSNGEGKGSQGSATSGTDKNSSLKKLDTLKIAELQNVDYERSDWKHWTGSPCNTREEVLKEQGTDVKADAKTCKITSGTWVDPYSNETFTDASKLDIDHVIPLSAMAQRGGQNWTPEQKETFANDKSQLLAVSATENRKKGDAGPGDYMPKNKDFHCEYSKLWVETADKYDATITAKDKRALEKGLRTCDA